MAVTRDAEPDRRPEWRVRAEAEIARGRREHGELYAEVERKLAAIDVESEREKIVGLNPIFESFERRAREEWKERILPFCWQALLERDREWPDWKLAIAVRMCRAVPHPLSAPVLRDFARRTPVEALRNTAESVAAQMPVEKRAAPEKP